jgi:pimeloyl-ACP methyl ester carboxylesterase
MLRVAYLSGGPRDGAPVVLLHGWPDDATTYARISPTLHEAGFRTFSPWLRGFESTSFLSQETMRSGEIAATAQDVLDLADALGLSRFAIVGHDWGARILTCWHRFFPERINCCAALSLGRQPGKAATPPPEQARACWYQWFMATAEAPSSCKGTARNSPDSSGTPGAHWAGSTMPSSKKWLNPSKPGLG